MSEGLRLATTDPELRRRALTILRKLALLSEASGASVVAFSSSGKKEDRPPPGVPNRLDKPKTRDNSTLYEYYVQAFASASDDYRLHELIFLAERDYNRTKWRSPARERVTANLPGENAEESDYQRICDLYEGMDALEVAIREEVNIAYVRKARAAGGRFPDDGMPKKTWQQLAEEEKRAKVTHWRSKGLTREATSKRLGVSTRTIRRYEDAA